MTRHWAEAAVAALLFLTLGVLLGGLLTAQDALAGEVKAPPLPPTRVDWAAAVQGPRQVLLVGRATEVSERANNLLLRGWCVVPGSVAIAASTDGGAIMVALEQQPRKVTK